MARSTKVGSNKTKNRLKEWKRTQTVPSLLPLMIMMRLLKVHGGSKMVINIMESSIMMDNFMDKERRDTQMEPPTQDN
jgi:hypothetical protein